MFPKKGNNFPTRLRRGGREVTYAAGIAAALRSELGNSHQAAKAVMRWTGVNERTAKNWLAGTSGPRGEHLIDLIRHSDTVLEAILRLADREQIIAANRITGARNILMETLQQLDACMEEGKVARRNGRTKAP